MSAFCEVRRQLAETFAIAARLYAEIAVTFAVPGISQEEYIRLCRHAEEAQKRSEAACVAYEEHVDLHRCLDTNSGSQNIAMGVGGLAACWAAPGPLDEGDKTVTKRTKHQLAATWSAM